MSNSQDANLSDDAVQFTPEDLDAIGEVMNISMGSAATSLSSMLDRQVVITTPKMNVKPIHDEDYEALEPAIAVRIKFVEGVLGTNIMVFRQRDMQIILNLLMGNEEIPDENDDFEFDDLSMSAACEVANQMMGSAATALSEVFNRSVNISTPDAFVSKAGQSMNQMLFGSETVEGMVGISFNLSIKGVMNSSFMSALPATFAKDIINTLMDPGKKETETAAAPAPTPAAAAPAPTPAAAAPVPTPAAAAPAPTPAAAAPVPTPPAAAPVPTPAAAAPAPTPPAAAPAPTPAPMPAAAAAPMAGQQAAAQPVSPQMMQQGYYYPPQMMQQQNGYYYPPQMVPPQGTPPAVPMPAPMAQPQVNVKKAKFPDFSQQQNAITTLNSVNMEMLMNVPLDVSVEIGKTRRSIKEIADFGQGTVIELEKQAGAPVDIIVNGQLLAHGDVVVIGDNFGVRITEIVGTKELMDSLGNL